MGNSSNNLTRCFKHALQGWDCHTGITTYLWPTSQLYTCLGQFGNIHYTAYHYTHLVSNLQLFSRFVCLLDSSCQYQVTASGITASARPMSHIVAHKEQLMLLSTVLC